MYNIKQMKAAQIPIMLAITGTLITGCTTYPKNYTYSPSVTISGETNTNTPIVLPNPYAETPRAKTQYDINTTYTSNAVNRLQENQPSIVNNYYPTYNHEETYVFTGSQYLQPQ